MSATAVKGDVIAGEPPGDRIISAVALTTPGSADVARGRPLQEIRLAGEGDPQRHREPAERCV